jgi:hypothetical protein
MKKNEIGHGYDQNYVLSVSDTSALLRTGIIATGCKPVWPRAIGLSLLLSRYSGSIVVTDRRCPSLLMSVVAMDTVAYAACRYYRPQQR